MIHHLFPGNFLFTSATSFTIIAESEAKNKWSNGVECSLYAWNQESRKFPFVRTYSAMMMWNWEINFPCREIKRFGSAKSNENALLRLAFFTSNYFPSCTFAARSMPCSSLSMADDLIVSKHDRSLHSPFFHAPLKRQTLASFATQLTHHSWLSTALNFELHHPPSERETTLEKKKKSWFDLHDNSSSTERVCPAHGLQSTSFDRHFNLLSSSVEGR